MTDTTIGALHGISSALVAILEELPVATHAQGPGITTAELATRLKEREMKVEGLQLMDTLRFLKAYKHIASDGIRWWRPKQST